MRTGVIILGLLVGLLVFYPEKTVTYGPGIVAPDDPLQERLGQKPSFPVDGYELTPLADFDITARILSTQRYSYGRESELSPVDLALGWGRMSDESVLEHFSISQRGRWMRWKARDLPIPRREINDHAANMHIIPADGVVEKQLLELFEGQVVHLTGSLVRVRAADGWTWTSSLTRSDTGSKACEVFYVESVLVVRGEV